jgi:hypothetical protein
LKAEHENEGVKVTGEHLKKIETTAVIGFCKNEDKQLLISNPAMARFFISFFIA